MFHDVSMNPQNFPEHGGAKAEGFQNYVSWFPADLPLPSGNLT